MKTSVTTPIILMGVLLTLCCQKEELVNSELEEQTNEQYEILSGACGTIKYKDTIGHDFDSALDSLAALRENFLIGGCPGNPCHEHYVEYNILTVNFTGDFRKFYGIKFMDSKTKTLIFAMSDVLDTKGNYYQIIWCPD